MNKKILSLTVACLSGILSHAVPSFNYVGNCMSYPGDGKFTLVPVTPGNPCGTNQVGAAWSTTQVDFAHNFVIEFKARVDQRSGSPEPAGADGFVVAFGNNITPTSINLGGGCLGYYHYAPNPDFMQSLGVEFDLYANGGFNDDGSDHIAVTTDADPNAAFMNLVGTTTRAQIHPTALDLPTGVYKRYRLEWNCNTKHLKVFYENNLRFEAAINPATVFGSSIVNWGFTGARGGDCSDFTFKDIRLKVYDVCSSCVEGDIDLITGHCEIDWTTEPVTVKYQVGITGMTPTPTFPWETIASYDWDMGDGTLYTEINPLLLPVSLVHDYTTPGWKTIKLKITKLLEQQIPCIIEITVQFYITPCDLADNDGDGDDDGEGGNGGAGKKPNNILGLSVEKAMQIFPNPANEQVEVVSEQKLSRVMITDMSGKVVVTHDCKGENKVKLNVSSIANGVYMVNTISTEDTQVRSKLVIQNK